MSCKKEVQRNIWKYIDYCIDGISAALPLSISKHYTILKTTLKHAKILTNIITIES